MGFVVAIAIPFAFMPGVIRASGFPLAITATTTNFQLATTTAPAGRLAWLMGTRPDAITNLVELESLPLVQHGYTFNYSGAAAFYRAAFIDTNITNTLTAPLAIGTFHAVAITTNGNIQSWGDNSLGQFGNGLPTTGMVSYAGCWVVTTGYTNASEGPLVQSSARHWSCVAAGDNCTLAVETNGSLWAWGDDTYGSLGVSTNGWPSSWSATPVAIGTNALWRSVFAYGDSSFAIRRDGTLWAWGDNTSSVLGVGTNFSSSNIVWFPTQVGNSSNWVSVFCLPNSHSVGIQTDGLLWAWGQTDLPTSVRAGYADTNDLLLAAVACPGLVNIPGPWISAGPNPDSSEFIFLRGDGTFWEPTTNATAASGWGEYYAFWQDQYTNSASLYNLLIGYGASPSEAYSYVYGDLFIPGYPLEASLNPTNFPAFVASVADANFLQPDPTQNKYAMLSWGIALNRDGTVWTTGDSPTRSPGSPLDGPWQRLNTDTDWCYVVGMRTGAKAAIKADGSVWIWNDYGKLNLSTPLLTEPAEIPTNTWLSAKVSETDVVALDTQSNLWVWGGNTAGQLGLGDYEPRLAPTPLPMAGPWLSLAVDDYLTVAVHQGGTLWAWGNFDNTGTNVTNPVQLNPERAWQAVYSPNTAGATNFCAIAEDGTLWQFGSTLAQQVPGTNWVSVSPTLQNIIATKSDGSLWGWGDYLGFGLTNSFFNTPVQLSASGWQSVSAGYADYFPGILNYDVPSLASATSPAGIDGFAIGSDGTLWSWGVRDAVCQLGQTSNESWANTNCVSCIGDPCGSPAPASEPFGVNVVTNPQPVGVDNDWKQVKYVSPNGALSEYVLGLKQDGSLWVWGVSPFPEVTNQIVLLTPPSNPYPGIPYPQYTSILMQPYQMGTNSWSYIDSNLGITSTGNLYLWGADQDGQELIPPAWSPQLIPVNVSSSAVFY